MTIKELLFWGKKTLRDKDIEGVESSAEYLLTQLIGKDRAYLLTHDDEAITEAQKIKYQEWIDRRAKHEPIWYITGKIEFLGLDLSVNQDVLIPRPETELLVEKIVEKFRGGFGPKSILDIGTGSGAIIISLAENLGSKYEHNIKYFASDVSQKALATALDNAKKLGFGDKIVFRQGSLFDPWENQKFDLIVTNLPYIPDTDRDTLTPDIVNFEPHLALFGGVDGLEIIRDFIKKLPDHLNPGGKVFMEIGYEQGDTLKDLVKQSLPKANVTVLTDYDNVDRIVIIEI